MNVEEPVEELEDLMYETFGDLKNDIRKRRYALTMIKK